MLILAQRADGEYAADTIVISIPRQVGKTYLIGCIIFALCLMKPGLKVIWTAQVKDTALETFDKFVTMTSRPKVKPHIAATPHGKGDEAIIFVDGSSIEFGARDSGFGRGRTDVDVIVFDEGQHLSTEALENMGAAQNVAFNPLCFVMGTPPRPRDKGEFFATLRQEALDGDSDGTLYVECSADPGADPMDREQWRKANPSYPLRTSERAMLRLRKKLKNPDSWNREALGIWDRTDSKAKISAEEWRDCFGAHDPAVPLGAVGIAATLDLTQAGIVAAGVTGDVVQVKPLQRASGVGWVVDRCKGLQDAHGCDVVIDGRGPAAVLIPSLEQAGVRLTVAKTGDVQDGCAGIVNLVRDKKVRHSADELGGDIKKGVGRTVGDRWVWDRKPGVPLLEAATLAVWKLTAPSEPDPTSAYEAHGVMTI